MDRVYYHDSDCCVSEIRASCKGIHLYDGEEKVFLKLDIDLAVNRFHFDADPF